MNLSSLLKKKIKIKKNQPQTLLFRSLPASSVHLPKRAQHSECHPVRTSSSWASHCLPVWISTHCSLFMLIYYTFSPLIRSPWLSKYDCSFSFSLPPSASFSPLPFHLFSPVASDQTEEKAAKTNKPALSAWHRKCQTLASQHSVMWLFATNLSVMLILQIQNRLFLVRSGRVIACFMVP